MGARRHIRQGERPGGPGAGGQLGSQAAGRGRELGKGWDRWASRDVWVLDQWTELCPIPESLMKPRIEPPFSHPQPLPLAMPSVEPKRVVPRASP